MNNYLLPHTKELMSTEPEQIYLEQKIYIPINKLFYINNPDS